MRYWSSLFIFCCVSGCTVTVPDYVFSLTDESTYWTTIHSDSTLPEIGVYAHYEHDKVVVSLTCYSHPDSIGFIQAVSVAIKEFEQQNVPMYFSYGEFPGTTKQYQEATNYVEVRDAVLLDCDSLECEQLHFIASRIYNVLESDLPEVLNANYTITTAKWGESSGNLQFKKTTREYEESMRFH